MSESVYYEVTGGEPLEFCRDFRARSTAAHEDLLRYAESKGGEGYTTSFNHLAGVIFPDDKAPAGWVAYKRKTDDGRPHFHPAKRNKALTEEFAAVAPRPSGREFAKRFNVPTSLEYEGTGGVHGSMAIGNPFEPVHVGWIGESFWVTLPNAATAKALREACGYTVKTADFVPPEGLQRSSRARYELALAAHKVAQEEAAEVEA